MKLGGGFLEFIGRGLDHSGGGNTFLSGSSLPFWTLANGEKAALRQLRQIIKIFQINAARIHWAKSQLLARAKVRVSARVKMACVRTY